ncbi:MAG: 50S ribosomal protein L30e [Candidatus Hodarchaeales archaeon]|jgi:large subunit ribosomal protein L30e
MARRKKRRGSKDKDEIDIGKSIAMAVRSGKTAKGAKTAIQHSRTGNAKAFIITTNTPKEIISELKYNISFKPEIKLIEYDKTSIDLGAAIGRPHPVSVLTIFDEGDSKILELAEPELAEPELAEPELEIIE